MVPQRRPTLSRLLIDISTKGRLHVNLGTNVDSVYLTNDVSDACMRLQHNYNYSNYKITSRASIERNSMILSGCKGSLLCGRRSRTLNRTTRSIGTLT